MTLVFFCFFFSWVSHALTGGGGNFGRFHRKMLESLRDSIDGHRTKSRSEALVDPMTYVLAICEIPSKLLRLYVSAYQVREYDRLLVVLILIFQMLSLLCPGVVMCFIPLLRLYQHEIYNSITKFFCFKFIHRYTRVGYVAWPLLLFTLYAYIHLLMNSVFCGIEPFVEHLRKRPCGNEHGDNQFSYYQSHHRWSCFAWQYQQQSIDGMEYRVSSLHYIYVFAFVCCSYSECMPHSLNISVCPYLVYVWILLRIMSSAEPWCCFFTPTIVGMVLLHDPKLPN